MGGLDLSKDRKPSFTSEQIINAAEMQRNWLLVYTLAAARKKGIDEFIEKLI